MTAETLHPGYPPGHPAFDGHFPGNPLVPGVLLLDAVVHALCEASQADAGGLRVDSVKFLAVVRPGEALTVHGEAGGGFSLRQGERIVATGSLAPLRAGAEQP